MYRFEVIVDENARDGPEISGIVFKEVADVPHDTELVNMIGSVGQACVRLHEEYKAGRRSPKDFIMGGNEETRM